jgi:hypothetical protein
MKGFGNRAGWVEIVDGAAGTISSAAAFKSQRISSTDAPVLGEQTRTIDFNDTDNGTDILVFNKAFVDVDELEAREYEDSTSAAATGKPDAVAIYLSAPQNGKVTVYAQACHITAAGDISGTAGSTETQTGVTQAPKKNAAALTLPASLVSSVTGYSVQVVIPTGEVFGYATITAV